MDTRSGRNIFSGLLFLCTFVAANQPFHLLLKLQPGVSFDVLSSYGYMYSTLHVTPIYHGLPWLILERTHVIFEDNPGSKLRLDHKGDILLDFCDSLEQLVKVYFRNFTIEGLQKPYKAFMGGWDKFKLAKNMGISQEYLYGNYSYILVRFIKKHTLGWIEISDSLQLKNSTKDWISLVSPGNTTRCEEFLGLAGTHYISTFVTGDTVYQVFVYEPEKFLRAREIKERQSVTQWTQEDVDLVFSPSLAKHIGKVMDVSQNDTVKHWLKRNLNYRFSTYRYKNLLKLYRRSQLKNQLFDLLPDESIVHLELKSVTPVFRNNVTRQWVEETLNNKLALWDSTIV